jgi:GNAT superfamily N-acetyltransferase
VKAKIDVRLARAKDKAAVVGFCRHTFGWGDYIAEVWDSWLADGAGRLLVAVIGGRPVGVLHTAFIGDEIAWMEGMRVNPASRRLGVASQMNLAALDLARNYGCRLARLATSAKNVPAQEMLQGAGYVRTASFGEWSAERMANGDDGSPEPFSSDGTRVAVARDEATVLSIWRGSPPPAASRSLLVDRRWRWRDLNGAQVHAYIADAQVRMAQRGFCVLFDDNDVDGGTLHMNALVGEQASMHSIAASARGEAAYRGYSGVEAMLVDQPAVSAALTSTGYRREGGMLIYEQLL